MVNQFVHLKTKSHYSILESSIKVDDLIDQAVQDNMPAIALTDTNNLFAAMEFTKKALEKKIKPILGADILWFGTSQKLLAILDYQPLIQEGKYLEKYCSSLGIIKKKYSAFDNNKMKNIYDSKKYFSPWVIICRGNKLNLDRDLYNIFHSFVNNYLNIHKSNPVNQFLNAEELKINQI